jgi:hypothetical protein
VLGEHGFGHHGTGAAGTGEPPGYCRQQVQEKDGQVAHRTILARSRHVQEMLTNSEFATDRPVPSSATQTGPFGLNTMPHGFTRSGSVWSAVLNPSDTRLRTE